MSDGQSKSGGRSQGATLAIVLTALVSVGPISTDLYLPSLPSMRFDLAASEGQAQLTLSAFLVGFALAQLFQGPLSDRFGRKPVMLGGLLVYVLASMACVFAPTIELLIMGRVLQALGACVGPVVGRAIVRDVYGPNDAARVLSYIGSAMALAPAVGPLIGGAVQEFLGWRANFYAMLIYGVIAVGLLLWLVPETNRYKDPDATRPGAILRNYRTLLRERRYLGYVWVTAAVFGGLFAFISGSSFIIIETLGYSPFAFGLCFLVFVTGFMTGSLLSGRFSRRFGVDRLILIGTSLSLAAGTTGAVFALAGVLNLWVILVPIFPFMVGCGMVLPNAFAGAIGPYPRMAGAASALLGFLQMVVGAASGVAVGQLADGTARPMMVMIFLGALLGFWARIVLLRGPSEPKDVTSG
ncbi:multidrug effflux MFS transporter [Limibacillus sp. MBR-115]|jgi:DHA1 family bicyclomycin/chloramphenicol resistance-like MFS transporter|uniref:multidrug effflux MFS transporter n=1 Tax=Limibacillus sp. MBR-115 TaxID=3156465 RepID=UPI0033976545